MTSHAEETDIRHYYKHAQQTHTLGKDTEAQLLTAPSPEHTLNLQFTLNDDDDKVWVKPQRTLGLLLYVMFMRWPWMGPVFI